MGAIEQVRGHVLRPGESGFDDECAGYQLAHPHRPAVIVSAVDAADVQAAVRYAADHGLPVDVQTTGHGRAAPLSGGVLISTRRGWPACRSTRRRGRSGSRRACAGGRSSRPQRSMVWRR